MLKRRVGRYYVFEAFARGGMASVHLGRLIADRGFSRLVAVKMLMRGQVGSVYARALEEEARIASRIRHPNVVQPLDFVVDGEDLLVVMEYVHGAALSQLVKASQNDPMPRDVTAAIVGDILKGLHAAHEATDELGRALGVVHRDVSPHNILVGIDGVARLADFGIAKVMRSTEQTQTGIVKGKLAYMPPEQLRGLPLTRQADIYSAGAVLAEALSGVSPDPADHGPKKWLPRAIERIDDPALLDVVRVATKSDARDRYATASEMAAALGTAIVPARADQVADRVTVLASDVVDLRSEMVRAVEAEPIDASGIEAVVSVEALEAAGGDVVAEEDPNKLVTLVNPIAFGDPLLGSSLRSSIDGGPIQEIDGTLHTLHTAASTSSSRPPPPPPPPLPVPASRDRGSIRIDAHVSAPPFGENTLEPANTTARERRRFAARDRGAGFFVFAGLALVLLVAGVWLRFGRPAAPSTDGAPATSPPAPVFPPAPLVAPSSRLPPASTTPAPLESVAPPTSALVLKPSPTVKRAPKPQPRPIAPDCNPPFRIDAEGKKHYKPECVE